jgi:hypothetical protein
MEEINEHQLRHRQRRARILANAYYKMALDACHIWDRQHGRRRRSDQQCAEDIAVMGANEKIPVWVALAGKCHINPPSRDTMDEARRLVVERARHEQGDQP